MIFVSVFLTLIGFGLGFLTGRASQYNNAREKLRIRVMQSNLNNLTPEKVNQLLDEL